MLLPNFGSGKIEAGVDEVGRGCLAGPVVAAAVIFPPSFTNHEINDSKQLSLAKRETIEKIILKEALAYAIAEVSAEEIDNTNILKASFAAMHKAIEQLNPTPEFLLIDGNRFTPYKEIPFECIVKGDGKYLSIAAASILAKTYRDRLMINLSKKHPEYAWESNVGYPTKAHREAIKAFGVTEYHRKSFRLLPAQTTIFKE